jgi:peptidoglycan/xylan/chitin deacetylase (PgdA/CDA1 family)
MFLVFNKQKIISYIVAFSTVAVLLGGANFFNAKEEESIQTSANTSRLLPIYSVETEEKKGARTMNCAWSADDIDTILDTLSKYKINITFFMVGEWVDKYPEAVKKISDAGNELANHSNTHPYVSKLTYEKNVDQIKECADKIEKITGKRTTLYRGPYGEYNDVVIKAAQSQNHTSIQWSLDTLDYKGLTEEEMWNRLKDKLKPGDIILMHNGTAHTAEALDKIIYNIQQKGYEIVTVSNLIYSDNYIIDVNGVQKSN